MLQIARRRLLDTPTVTWQMLAPVLDNLAADGHPNSLYLRINDLPKLERLNQEFPKLWREDTAPWRAAPERA